MGRREEAARHYKEALEGGKNDPSIVWGLPLTAAAEQGLGNLAADAGDAAEAAHHFETAVGVVERTRSDFTRTDLKLPFLNGIIGLYRRYVDLLLQRGEIERALVVADSSHAQVLAERSGAPPARRLAPGTVRKLAVDINAVLVSYWLGPERSHAWVVTP